MSDRDRPGRHSAPPRTNTGQPGVGACLLRGLPLFFCAAPKTPLRVLCIIALDTVHVLRTAQPLPRKRMRGVGNVPGFSSLHECGVGSQGSVRGRIPGAAAAAGESRPARVDRGIPQSASRVGNTTTADRRGSSALRRGSFVPRGSRAAVACVDYRDRAERRVSRRRNPGDAWRQRCGRALSNGDAVPDHRRRHRLQKGSVGGLAEFPDSICVAAAGHGIDCRSGTVLCPERRALSRRRCIPAASGALCRHSGDEARRWCGSKREVDRRYGLLDAASATRGNDNVVEVSGEAL